MEQINQPEEGQHDGQEAGATHGSPKTCGLRRKHLKAAKLKDTALAVAHLLKSASCSVQSRPHSSKCTLFFPFRGLAIGANHKER